MPKWKCKSVGYATELTKKMKKYISTLGRSALFHGISEEKIDSLVKCLGCLFKTFDKGEMIYLAGDSVREMGIVISGRLHIVKDDIFGNSNIITHISAGEMFAETVFCGGVCVLPATVMAVAKSQIMFLDFQRIITPCSPNCVFHTLLIRNMLGELARKNIMLAGKIKHITKRTTKEKLMSYLSEQSRLHQSSSFEIPFDRQELADYLSVERSALSAQMSKLKEAGIINYWKNYFEILKNIGFDDNE